MKNKKPQKVFEGITIEDAGAKGMCVAKAEDGLKILMPYGVPGDVVNVLQTKKRRNYLQGSIIEILKESEDRISPRCEHFGVCGGCKWQQMDYEKQLYFKQKEITNNLKKIANLTAPNVMDILGCDSTFHYRNKMEFSFSNNRWLDKKEMDSEEVITNKNALGFHIAGMWDKILDIENCYLHTELSNNILKEVKAFAIEHEISFFDVKQKKGLLRNLMIRTNSDNQAMVLIQFYKDNAQQREQILNHIAEKFPEIKSLLYVINTKQNDTIYDLETIIFKGQEFIMEHIGKYQFKINAKSFFQTNTKQAEKLYEIVNDFCNLVGDEILYDLYSGTGSIAIYLAKKSKKVIGIETVKEAVKDAKENAKLNNINNVSFFNGDVKHVLNQEFITKHKQPDIIVTDPPREGLSKDVIKKLLEISSKKIIYVSCNSATQARDIELLSEQYILEKIQPVDMFPHTFHIENVACLIKK